jgi:serine protease Do/serine protease DegQ
MAQLIEHGEVRRGLLGVRITDVNRDIAEAAGSKGVTGAFVSEVDEGSAAEAAGIEAGDIITAVNGAATESASELRNSIGLLAADEEVRVDLVRKGKKKTVVAALRPRQAPQQISGEELHGGLEGASLADITGATSAESGITTGVLVTGVNSGSQASLRGLRPQDVITEVNGSEVSNVSELREAVEDEKSLLLRIRRGRSTVMIPIQ